MLCTQASEQANTPTTTYMGKTGGSQELGTRVLGICGSIIYDEEGHSVTTQYQSRKCKVEQRKTLGRLPFRNRRHFVSTNQGKEEA